MEVKDAITIMFLFGMFILALLTYINNNNKRKSKPTQKISSLRWVLIPVRLRREYTIQANCTDQVFAALGLY
ncbi:hypothetical protein PNBC_16670 [Paenibacillus crassostreae]|uniref:Uncharacterized protein n=1 Tax=Paenibacillus crassostreae TaxID=1763538 RepID=A0A167BWK7_9BACL|nr:hypothetical protein LPB68_10225 [Paenibacillus crassostreae]OAB72524.1 hypothetical protein PNBC_16670 [Paenibacillus crassostreae]